jgi:hypothetical protein
VHELRVQGNWTDLLLFRRRVRLLEIGGLHVLLPPAGSRAMQQDFPAGSSADFAGPTTPVETLDIEDAHLDLLQRGGTRSSYPIQRLVLHGVQKGQAALFDLDMQNTLPSGRIQAHGSFGPLQPSGLGTTPVSGEFVFSPVHLAGTGTLRGTLAANGRFSGQLANIQTTIAADVPDFAVGDGQPVAISGSAQCTVNALNANVLLHTIDLRTGATLVEASGAVMGSPKVTDLDIQVTNGRAQDLLRPFLHERVPVAGAVSLKGHAHVAETHPGETFLHRLTLTGRFDLPTERLTDAQTERSLTAFSARAQGASSASGQPGDPATAAADVISSIAGEANIRNGIASTNRLTVTVPGANVRLRGTYALVSGAVHLTGQLKMQADLSHAVTGFKSWLLKPFAPFFRKKNAGAVVSIAVTGRPRHYKVSQNVLHTK